MSPITGSINATISFRDYILAIIAVHGKYYSSVISITEPRF